MEKIILVDINDNAIGDIEKLEAHKTPKLHRAFSVFIYNNGKLLLQKRNVNKYHSGGLWANSLCSHPRYGKTFDTSVKERAKFELGINDLKFKELFTFTYLTKFNNNLFEYELDHVLLSDYCGNIDFNKDEIEEVKWMDLDELSKDLTFNPEKYASWFIICAPRVIAYLKNSSKQMKKIF